MKNNCIVYSHGFGVRNDDRCLFTDIAEVFSDTTHIMFDFNEFDEHSNTLIARPFEKKAVMLDQQIETVRYQELQSNPDDRSTCGWLAESELPQTFVSEKDLEDDEVKAIYKGSTLLEGGLLDLRVS